MAARNLLEEEVLAQPEARRIIQRIQSETGLVVHTQKPRSVSNRWRACIVIKAADILYNHGPTCSIKLKLALPGGRFITAQHLGVLWVQSQRITTHAPAACLEGFVRAILEAPYQFTALSEDGNLEANRAIRGEWHYRRSLILPWSQLPFPRPIPEHLFAEIVEFL